MYLIGKGSFHRRRWHGSCLKSPARRVTDVRSARWLPALRRRHRTPQSVCRCPRRHARL